MSDRGSVIVELGAHENMSPEEALAIASREAWDDVAIIGYQDNELVCRSSRMSRAEALWLIEMAKLHVMNKLDP